MINNRLYQKTNSIIKNFLYKNKFLSICIFIEIIILFAYWINDPKILAKDFYDSMDYLDYANAFNYGFKSFFSDFRAPIYPLILFFLKINDPLKSNLNLYLVQVIFHLISLTLMWKILEKLLVHDRYKKVIFILIIFGIDYFWMTKTMLSEVTSSLFLLISIYLIVLWIEKQKTMFFYISVGTYLLLVLTRPFYVYMISIYIFMLTIKKLKKELSLKSFIFSLFAIFLFCIFILGYNTVNYRKFKYFGISTEGGINLFSRVAEYPELLPKEYKKDPKLLDYAQNCRKHNKDDSFSCIYNFYPHVNIPLPRNDSNAKKVEEFSMYALKNNFIAYTAQGLPYFYKTISDVYLNEGVSSIDKKPYDYWYGFKDSQPLTIFFRIITFHQQQLHYFFSFSVFIFGIPLAFYYLITLVKSKKSNNDVLLKFIFLGIVYYHIVITGYVAIGDMSRMLVPALPIVYIISFSNAEKMVNVILKFRSKA